MIRNQNKIFALGRLKTGEMNQGEKKYAEYLDLLLHLKQIAWYKFEGIKFRLADNTFFSPDFVVMMPNGEMQIRDVKGYMMEDANVKIKMAAEIYPFRFFIVKKQAKKDGGGWKEIEI